MSKRSTRASTEPQSPVRLGHSASVPNAWTPGPWAVSGQWIRGPGDNGNIARAVEYVGEFRAEGEANARLITAAPDYDAFAEHALPLLEVLHSTCQSDDTRKAVWSCILAGRAAFAKARGDQ